MEISFQTMFSYPTIAAIIPEISAVKGKSTEEYQPFSLLSEEERQRLPANIDDAYPLSMLQAGLIFQSELQKGASPGTMTFRFTRCRAPLMPGHSRRP